MKLNILTKYAVSCLISLCVVCLVHPLNEVPIVTAEEDVEENRELKKDLQESLFFNNYGLYKDEKIFYKLDITNDKEKLEQSTADNIWNYLSFGFVDDKSAEIFYNAMFFTTETIFRFNVMMTKLMLTVLNFGYDLNIINELIEGLEQTLLNVTGITSAGKFTSGGLFGGFVGVVSLLSVIYTIYAYTVKRASIESMESILKTVLAFTVALLFFSNYSSVLKGMNVITTEASSVILSGSTVNSFKESSSNQTLKEKMNDNIWTLFVERPYLYFQYGSDNRTEIGEDRIKALLVLKPYSKERSDFVENEVIEHNNEMMTYPYAPDRFTFSWIVLIANGVASIPIFLLGFSLMLFQIWFMALATIAPFAFIFAALPGQFGVLKKYLGELTLPLALKIVISILALFLFLMSEVVYNINLNSDTGSGYIATVAIQFIILFSIFLLRKRIMGIFSAGSKEIMALRSEIGTLKENMKEKTIIRPVKGAATVAGAAAGGSFAGAQGALVGANLGNSLGKTIVGEKGVGDFGREAGRSAVYWQLKKNKSPKSIAEEKKRSLDSKDSSKVTPMPQPSNTVSTTSSDVKAESSAPAANSSSFNEDLNYTNLKSFQPNPKDSHKPDIDFQNKGLHETAATLEQVKKGTVIHKTKDHQYNPVIKPNNNEPKDLKLNKFQAPTSTGHSGQSLENKKILLSKAQMENIKRGQESVSNSKIGLQDLNTNLHHDLASKKQKDPQSENRVNLKKYTREPNESLPNKKE